MPGSKAADAAAPFGAASEGALKEGPNSSGTVESESVMEQSAPLNTPNKGKLPTKSENKEEDGARLGAEARAKVVPQVINIPLWGPCEYGVWKDHIVDGVEALRSYLVTHRKDHGCKLPMRGTSDIMCYTGYTYTTAK